VVQSAPPALARPATPWLRARARLRSRLTTTPGRMRLAGAAIVVGLLVLAVVGTGAVRARQRAATAIGDQAEPLLVGSESMYSSLADADATATNTFLEAGMESPARRQAYLDDLQSATGELTTVAGQAGTAPAVTQALGVVDKDLPTYSGLVEDARSNNLQGFPVGASYLGDGSTLMQTAILPAVGQVYQAEAGRLTSAYNSGRSWLDVFGVVLFAVVGLALLLLTQLFVARRTNRVFNAPLLVASLLTVVLMGWTVAAFLTSASQLNKARTGGSDPVQLLASARILVSRAQVDENLALVARGSDPQYLADFDAVTTELGPSDGSSGLLAEAQRSVASSSTPLTGRGGLYADYLTAHQAVVAAENSASFSQAVSLATGSAAGDELPAATQLSAALSARIQQAQGTFQAKAAAARHDLSALTFAVLGLAVLAAALAMVGLELRINEYR
jgi:hypothetical protein